jgi:glycyl-tRNA synthetase beta chain
MADFLLEIGLEEIPARMIDGAEAELRQRVEELLQRESLCVQTSANPTLANPARVGHPDMSSGSPEIEAYSTPRRLAVLARGIAEKQADAEEQVLGPSVKVAYKDGQPTRAAQAFAEKVNVDLSQLKAVKTAKGEYLAAAVTRKGRTAEEILAESLPKEINALYWAKNMYWREGKPERFVRPVRWMVALLGERVVPLEYGGVKAGRASRGHRLLGKTPTSAKTGQMRGTQENPTQAKTGLEWATQVLIGEPGSYAGELKEAGVFAKREERLALIRKELDGACRAVAGGRWREDRELLDTVVNLTEFPSVILGSFEREFLELPEEVLVTVMRDHQKYFAVEESTGKLAPHFLAVLNTDSDPQGLIRHGNERVLRARFRDARFFWDTDQKHPLRERVEWLKNVTFQKDLGSYFDKTLRVQKLTSQICEVLNSSQVSVQPQGANLGHPAPRVRAGIVHKAALLAKTDLTTELVKEFTELQGIVGGLYAKAQNLEVPTEAQNAIATGIYDQYKPESMEDAVPRTVEGAVLSIADKADSIAGMFALGLIPSGSKDPFALRRQANGIVKIVAEHKLALSLDQLFRDAWATYANSEAAAKFTAGEDEYLNAVTGFFRERLEFYLRDALGFAYDVVNAVLAAGADDVVDAVARAEAVAKVRPSEDFEAISAAFKRIKNILRQARETGKKIGDAFDPAALSDDAERALAQEMQRVAPRVRELASQGNYAAALAEIATIRPAVDRFFDKVMVMVEDDKVRANRLALLQVLLNEFSTIADFSEIVVEKK